MKLKIQDISHLSMSEKETLKKRMSSKYGGHVAIVPVMRKSGHIFSSYLFSHSLATCLAVILWNKEDKEAVMAHITHPKDAQTVVKKMIEMLSHGDRSIIKIFQAAIVGEGTNRENPITAIVEQVLKKYNISVKIRELKKHYSMWVLFNIRTGEVEAYRAEYVETILPVNS